MSLKTIIARTPIARPLVIRLLKLTQRNSTIRNPWTNDAVYLNTFYHKGYWFYGTERERDSMKLFAKYVPKGGVVLECGGHIGFISQYFSRLVGDNGRVIVFEPGENNLPYLRRNTQTLGNVSIEESAISDGVGSAVFYEDNISGQNGSLLPEYSRADNVAASHSLSLKKQARNVNVTTIDDYVRAHDLHLDFIKIDIEGNEFKALAGAKETLQRVTAMMVEVTENLSDVSDLLLSSGFRLHDESGSPLARISTGGNIFAIKT